MSPARPVNTPVRTRRHADSESFSPDKSKSETRTNNVDGQLDLWLKQNEAKIAQAENMIHARLDDPDLMHEKMPLCEEVMKVMKAVLNTSNSANSSPESKSVLVLGEAGSGKTQAVDWCLHKLRQEHPSLVALRARGGAYASNVECLRHLASQVAGQLVSVPTQNSSFEGSMEWFRSILRESFKRDSAVVIVLDRFEHFCDLARQTLLYNLFNLAQDLSVRLCVVGISEKFDVTKNLEKRIQSRFSMHSVLAFLPKNMEELLQVLEHKLHLPEDCSLGAEFTQQFNEKVSEALEMQAPDWREHLEENRPPSWFLLRCLPVASFLSSRGDASSTTSLKRPPLGTMQPPAKRSRFLGDVLGTETKERRQLLLSGLSECEHLVLLALMHLEENPLRPVCNLSRILHELMLLVESTGGVLAQHTEDRFSAAFYRLVKLQLVGLCAAAASSDVPKRYLACENTVGRLYGDWVSDLERSEPTTVNNPLRSMPTPVQLWAVKMRR